jgi:hypothetical protein
MYGLTEAIAQSDGFRTTLNKYLIIKTLIY